MKNLFKFEFNKNKVSLMWWSGIMFAMVLLVSAIFPYMRDYFVSIPQFLGHALSTPEGWFGTEISTVMLMGGTLFAATLGGGLISADFRSGDAQFIYTLPYSRGQVVSAKKLVLVTNVAIFVTVLLVASFIGMIFLKINALNLLIYMIMAFVTFVIIGIIVSSITQIFAKTRTVGASVGIGFAFFILNFVSQLLAATYSNQTTANVINSISPLGIANSNIILNGISEINIIALATWIVIAAVFAVVAKVNYKNKDLI